METTVRTVWTSACLIGLAFCALGESPLDAVVDGDSIVVRVNDRVFVSYKFADGQKYPYLYPVNAPASGRSVTTESSEPYPHHHSLWIACDKVNGHNYWQDALERGAIVSTEPRIAEQSRDRIVISDVCIWQAPPAPTDFIERRAFTITAPDGGIRFIDCEFRLEAAVDLRIERTNHSLFAARVAPELCVNAGGRLINAEGKKSEAETLGVPSPWCDYSGVRDGVREGIAIFQHPDNRWHPSPWFTRDYGFFSPTPLNWIGDEGFSLAKGEVLTLRYRVVVYSGEMDLRRLYADYTQEPMPAGPR